MKRDRSPGSHIAVRAKERRAEHRAARQVSSAERIKKPALRPSSRIILVAGTAACMLMVISLVLLFSADSREYDNYMDRAASEYLAGDYDSALSCLRKALSIEETEACLLMMADCYEKQENYEKALELLRRLESPSDEVKARIAELEQQRARLLGMEKIELGGKLFSQDASALVLDGLDLKEADLELLIQFKELDNLSLAENSLKDLSGLTALKGLVTLNLSGNSVSDISPLAELSGLRSLYLDNNPIRDLAPLLKLENLTNLSIRGIDISQEQLDRLSAALPNCAIHSDVSSGDVVDISLGGLTFKSDVRELDLSGRGLRDVSALENCKDLVRLDISGNDISDLYSLMNIPGLEWLDASDNKLTDLRPLIGMSTLRTVLVSGNSISGTSAVGAMTALKELDLSENPLSDLSGLKKLRNLESLGLDGTGLVDDDLQYLEYLSSLAALSIEENPELSGEAVDKLQAALGSCVIEHSELIYSIDVGGNPVKSNATELSLSGLGISDISGLGNLNFLEKIDLSGNSISNIYILQYTGSRDDIRILDLSANAIEDITPIAGLAALEELDLSDNKISSVQALMSMSSLKKLDLSGNPLTDEQIKTLQDSLTSCEISW